MSSSSKFKQIFSRPKESLSRPLKWVFGIPFAYIIYIVLSMFVPVPANKLLAGIIPYIILSCSVLFVVKYFNGMDLRKFTVSNGKFDLKLLFSGFLIMLITGLATTFIWMLFNRQDFEFTFTGFSFSWILSLILIVVAAVSEELIYRCYIAYFLRDELERDTKKQLVYCIVSAVLFAVSHFENPEVSGSKAYYSMAFYFIMGFALMFFYFKTEGMEFCLGIHIGNNLISAWFFTYDNAVLNTNALFTHHNGINGLLLVQTLLCLFSCYFILRTLQTSNNK